MSTVTSLATLTLLRELTIAVALDRLSWEWMNDITSAALRIPLLTMLVWRLWSDGPLNLVKGISLHKLIHSEYRTEPVVVRCMYSNA